MFRLREEARLEVDMVQDYSIFGGNGISLRQSFQVPYRRIIVLLR